ncbi:galectin-3-binding protein, partial [Aphelenchoides avenae]
MESTPNRSAMWSVPVAENSVFRLEVPVAGDLTEPGKYTFEHIRCGEKWVMEVERGRHLKCFAVALQAPESVKTFSHKPYVRTYDHDIQYGKPENWMSIGVAVIVGAEVTVESPARPTSPWNFESSEHMESWDVVLRVGDTKFYAHKTVLTFASPTFRAMFERDFREKGQQEIPVNVPEANAEHFEAFLQCLYPGGSEPKAEFLVPLVTLADFYNVKPLIEKYVKMLKVAPNVSNVDKLRVAIKVNSTSLE